MSETPDSNMDPLRRADVTLIDEFPLTREFVEKFRRRFPDSKLEFPVVDHNADPVQVAEIYRDFNGNYLGYIPS